MPQTSPINWLLILLVFLASCVLMINKFNTYYTNEKNSVAIKLAYKKNKM